MKGAKKIYLKTIQRIICQCYSFDFSQTLLKSRDIIWDTLKNKK